MMPVAPTLVLSGTEVAPGEGVLPLIESCRATNVNAVELWVPRNTDRDGLDTVFETLTEAGLRVASLSAGIELFRDDRSEARRQQAALLDMVNLAIERRVTLINTYLGFSARQNDDRLIEGYLDLAAPCLARARSGGVTLVIENEFDAFGWDPAGSDITRRPKSLRKLLDLADTPAHKTTFDPANFVCAGVDPVDEAYPLLACHIAYVHVKNVVPIDRIGQPRPGWIAYNDNQRGFSTCGLTEGAVDWARVFEMLATDGYRGLFCLEPHSIQGGRLEAWMDAAGTVRRLAGRVASTEMSLETLQ